MATISGTVRILLMLSIFSAVLGLSDKPRYENEYMLHQALLGPESHYTKAARPVMNTNEKVQVRVYPQIMRVEGIDERIDTLTTTLSLTQNWDDPRFMWNPDEYGNISVLHLPLRNIWKPDLTLYNVAPGGEPQFDNEAVAVVSHTGSVTYVPFTTYSSYCQLNMENFPRDTQTCRLVFGSWVYNAMELDFEFWTQENKTALKVKVFGVEEENINHIEHPQWTLVGNSAQGAIEAVKYKCCPETYTTMTITMQLQRLSTFYRYVAVGPSVVLAMLVPVQFLLPVTSPQRTTFGLLIILSYTILIMTLSFDIPLERGSVPRIGIFYIASMTFASLGVLFSSILAVVANKGTRRRAMPAWLHSWCLGPKTLRRLLCVDNVSPVHSMYSSLNMHLLDDAGDVAVDPIPSRDPDNLLAREMDTYNTTAETHLRSIAKSTRVLAGKTISEDELEKLNNDWQDLARLLDRVFFIVFVILFLITCFSLVAVN